MTLPFDISPLNPGNVIDFNVVHENGVEVCYLTYKNEQCLSVPEKLNVRLVLSKSEMLYKCDLCGNRYSSSNVSRCRVCGGGVRSAASDVLEKQNKPKTELRYFEKANAKDKLINLCGRPCLILGTTEAVINAQVHSPNKVFLLVFYDFYQNSAPVKFEILQYFYYEPSSGKMFVDPKLNELNKKLWYETIEHNFSIVPKWNVVKISEIYLNGSV